MSEYQAVRTSLEVGFPEGAELPSAFAGCRGKNFRSIEPQTEFPFEDRQFEVVIMAAGALSTDSVKEAHRVLKPTGRLLFKVPAKTRHQEGYTMADIYSLVRYGFDIIRVDRPKWWYFGCRGNDITIFARKKNWKQLNNTFRPLV